MKQKFLMPIFFLLISNIVFAQNSSPYQYIFPLPGSKNINPENNIIIKPGSTLNSDFMNNPAVLKVVGSISGNHSGELLLSDDNKTIIFNPYIKFALNEKITVRLNDGVKTISGTQVQPYSFNFYIRDKYSHDFLLKYKNAVNNYLESNVPVTINKNLTTNDDLPLDFPPLTVDTVNNAAKGDIFMVNILGTGFGNYLMIVDSTGNPVKYKKVPNFSVDFKIQPNGIMSYGHFTNKPFFTGWDVIWYLIDTTFAIVDSFETKNGYNPEFHGFLLLPNGHSLLLAFDPISMDMSEVVTGGNPNAVILGGVIQELDSQKNVVFQWRSLDNIPVTESYASLTDSVISYIHINSIDVDKNGNILVSGRNINQIFKIDRNTSNFIWRLGGNNNEFTFVNEHSENGPNYFSGQHDAKFLTNDNITVFDNGANHLTKVSRAVEYKIDETNKTATLVWEYYHPDNIFSPTMGSIQKLSNGNTLIGWGTAGNQDFPAVTEIHPDSSIAFQMKLPSKWNNYRAYKYEWRNTNVAAGDTALFEVAQGNSYPSTSKPIGIYGLRIKFDKILSGIGYNEVYIKRYTYSPLNPEFTGVDPIIAQGRWTIETIQLDSADITLEFDLKYLPDIDTSKIINIYHRKTVGTGLFSEYTGTLNSQKNIVTVSIQSTTFGEFALGTKSIITGIDNVSSTIPVNFSLSQNYPNPFNPSTVISYQLPKISKVSLTVYDMLGREVSTLVNKEQAAGIYNVNFDASHLSSGIYFYTLITGDFIQTKKLVLLK